MTNVHDPLSAQAITAALSDLPGWELKDDKLHREFKFSDFKTAFSFMTRVADAAEALNHHPEWSNVYSRVTIDLWTHEIGAISTHDLELAAKINELS